MKLISISNEEREKAYEKSFVKKLREFSPSFYNRTVLASTGVLKLADIQFEIVSDFVKVYKGSWGSTSRFCPTVKDWPNHAPWEGFMFKKNKDETGWVFPLEEYMGIGLTTSIVRQDYAVAIAQTAVPFAAFTSFLDIPTFILETHRHEDVRFIPGLNGPVPEIGKKVLILDEYVEHGVNTRKVKEFLEKRGNVAEIYSKELSCAHNVDYTN